MGNVRLVPKYHHLVRVYTNARDTNTDQHLRTYVSYICSLDG